MMKSPSRKGLSKRMDIDAKMSPTVEQMLSPTLLNTAIWLDWATMGQKASEWRQRWEREVKSRL